MVVENSSGGGGISNNNTDSMDVDDPPPAVDVDIGDFSGPKTRSQDGRVFAPPGEAETDDGEQLSFGGFSFDDAAQQGVPICKHILACLLAEKWEAALGGYVLERSVTREEMAGIVADV